ncbi:MAG: hypothetical protein A2493_00610 [Candidatus Magasanikbacteria bacterium RIFOXYC12_FULL_33_11]|uniref:DUF5671 domain-containing protein n=1 Tax=Candidatus Magasanikbacteria bacterium RIFOXYC12_FULL_33_11 TaxID=1798701 RepID=A0A1F6NLQ8_9BACT|nr:MAG: hypothetical protein A2493_00610 [Candidatus Magasanikbacteria bacterium RIFOXYC12_FULL_33_11]
MKSNNSLYVLSGILILVMIILYTITHFVGILGQEYFIENQDKLTIAIPYEPSNPDTGYNYYYTKTPFDYFYRILTIISLIIPVFLVFYFSITEFKKKINKENYFKTLLLPLSYAFTNIISFLIFADKETGWEYSYGLYIIIAWSILIFIILAVTNLVILSKKN